MYLFLTQFNNIYQLYTLFQTFGQNPEVKSDSDKMFPFAFLCNIIWKKETVIWCFYVLVYSKPILQFIIVGIWPILPLAKYIFLNSSSLGLNALAWLWFCSTALPSVCTNLAMTLSALLSAARSSRTLITLSSPSSPSRCSSRSLPWGFGEKWHISPMLGINWTCSLSLLGKCCVVVLALVAYVLA